MKKITIFTPTYNRVALLPRAYDSLKRQTCKNFEWLIIDDGSQDETRALIESYILENEIDIVYIYQENRGQYFATNTAITNANSELFAFLDSDDYLADNAIERLIYFFEKIKSNDEFAGVAGLKAYFDGSCVGGEVDYDTLDCTNIDYRYKYKYTGDKYECFKTKLIKEHLFPIFEGKYAPNALLWNRMSHKKMLRFFNEKLYFCEYEPGSMSSTIVQNRQSTPDAYLLHYSELSKYKIPLWYKLRAGINFWRFAPYSKKSIKDKIRQIGVLNTLISIVPGFFMFLKDPKYKL
ncbi:glycosyltransferase family A protein [Ancylomarina sp. 16SWW S1-10-2]|uniref:glycosyltransferase family A protein n=1 Tax=Ancylomarina sp. 16SWW S1-10-2 TaxID=2499681 RepID=UPI0012AE4406|nr:glycosyltransferase family 2 protein [Ancylomarina sp. 16SWW S1-10-2]MRT93426.1 glycosyltransferase family 2 protein [Ancylomarina sp. 16SWW S1-10-2]